MFIRHDQIALINICAKLNNIWRSPCGIKQIFWCIELVKKKYIARSIVIAVNLKLQKKKNSDSSVCLLFTSVVKQERTALEKQSRNRGSLPKTEQTESQYPNVKGRAYSVLFGPLPCQTWEEAVWSGNELTNVVKWGWVTAAVHCIVDLLLLEDKKKNGGNRCQMIVQTKRAAQPLGKMSSVTLSRIVFQLLASIKLLTHVHHSQVDNGNYAITCKTCQVLKM